MCKLFIYYIMNTRGENSIESKIQYFDTFIDIKIYIEEMFCYLEDPDWIDFAHSGTMFVNEEESCFGFYFDKELDPLRKERVKNETLINFIQRNE